MNEKGGFRSGYVALIGRPNVGKSTLMNRMLGEKLSIVTDKPQTTRNRILGIKTTDTFQILFLDTPGIHRSKHRFNEIMLKTSLSTLEDADLILFLVDALQTMGQGERFIIDKLHDVITPNILIINKIDRTRKQRLLPLIDEYKKRMDFQEILPISALTGDGVAALEDLIPSFLPEGPPYFPEDSLTDLSQRFMIAEMIREKVIQRTQKEIPHVVAVKVEAVKKREGEELIDVDALIYTEKDSQKGILIGRGGQMLKEIGMAARLEIEEFLRSKVYLRLWVKVRKDWRSQLRMLKELGFE
jgi:GTP-binding protein Era